MKAYRCSVCREWVPDFRAYSYEGRLYCDEDLPSDAWEARLNGDERQMLTGDRPGLAAPLMEEGEQWLSTL